MAAGLGFKTFTTGEVLTAADTNGYLMQGINVFASTAARDAAITSPQEGQFAFTKDTNGLWYYDGAAWVASGATGDIEGVSAGIGISGGGTSGTVTVTNSMATAIDAKGDLVAGTGADAFSRLGVGANNTVLTADSAEATGLKWATPASGGGMTLLSTTSLSGASTTISSISGAYKALVIYVLDWYSSSNANVLVTVNGDTTAANYQSWYAGSANGNTVSTYGENNNVGFSMDGIGSHNGADNNNFSVLYFPDYANTTTRKVFTCTSGYVNASGKVICNSSTYYSGTVAAISSMRFLVTVGSWSGGSVLIYGVN